MQKIQTCLLFSTQDERVSLPAPIIVHNATHARKRKVETNKRPLSRFPLFYHFIFLSLCYFDTFFPRFVLSHRNAAQHIEAS